ncbi:hypothetical protein R3P38DRAFT_2786890 [Favolaschia claudopus]|uniref:Uncharacterized protein n=1 Tax=Favolaschia claudopus TaxID=2862362 RepID=A0AAW0AQZ8_9AGAR
MSALSTFFASFLVFFATFSAYSVSLAWSNASFCSITSSAVRCRPLPPGNIKCCREPSRVELHLEVARSKKAGKGSHYLFGASYLEVELDSTWLAATLFVTQAICISSVFLAAENIHKTTSKYQGVEYCSHQNISNSGPALWRRPRSTSLSTTTTTSNVKIVAARGQAGHEPKVVRLTGVALWVHSSSITREPLCDWASKPIAPSAWPQNQGSPYSQWLEHIGYKRHAGMFDHTSASLIPKQ